MIPRLLLFILILLVSNFSFGQRRDNDGELQRLRKEAEQNRVRTPQGWYHAPVPHSKIRNVLSFFHLEVTTGWNKPIYSHRADAYGVYSGQLGTRIFNPADYDAVSGNISESLSQWFNSTTTTGAFGSAEPDFVSVPNTKYKFKSKSFAIPLSAALFFKISRFRIGGGYSFEPQWVRSFYSTKFRSEIDNWKPDRSLLFVHKYYGMLGGDVYRYQDFLFSADVRIGGWNPGSRIAYSSKSLMFAGGIGVEYQKSEYFRPYARLGYEVKNFVMPSPIGPEIKFSSNELTFNIGMIMQIPKLPKCFIKNCRIQMNHQHGDREYRSRAHPFWKKQNPGYGENYPRLMRYKRKNRGKLNPY